MQPTAKWLSMPELAKRTGIPYPTVARYVQQHEDRFITTGDGKARRFEPGAVETLRQIRSETRPGRPPKAPEAPSGTNEFWHRLYRLELRILDLAELVERTNTQLRLRRAALQAARRPSNAKQETGDHDG